MCYSCGNGCENRRSWLSITCTGGLRVFCLDAILFFHTKNPKWEISSVCIAILNTIDVLQLSMNFFNKEKPCVCIPTLLHYLLWCSFVWLWSHLVRHSRFRLSGKDARVRSCKGKSSKVRGQRSWSAKIWRQRVKKRRCAVAKAKKRYFYIAYLLRNCALSSSHLHTFAFTFFSLHNLMQVPYLSEICRRCYGVIALNAVWRPSCLL